MIFKSNTKCDRDPDPGPNNRSDQDSLDEEWEWGRIGALKDVQIRKYTFILTSSIETRTRSFYGAVD